MVVRTGDVRREGRLLRRLTHPNIVRVYEVHGGWIVLETLSGSTLADGRIEPGTGTRRWMAPEQQRGGRVSDKTDVWGIAAVLRSVELDLEVPEDPAERPAVEDVLRWLDGLQSPRPAHPRQAA